MSDETGGSSTVCGAASPNLSSDHAKAARQAQNDDYDTYLAVLPADVLAQVYERHCQG